MYRRYAVHEVLSILKNDVEFSSASLFILPPSDPSCSDEDSGDEEGGVPDNLSRRQLEAEAVATVKHGIDKEVIGVIEEDNIGLVATASDILTDATTIGFAESNSNNNIPIGREVISAKRKRRPASRLLESCAFSSEKNKAKVNCRLAKETDNSENQKNHY